MVLSPFSLFIKPGLLTLKQHSDRGAKRKKDLQKKNRKEGEKDLGSRLHLGVSELQILAGAIVLNKRIIEFPTSSEPLLCVRPSNRSSYFYHLILKTITILLLLCSLYR